MNCGNTLLHRLVRQNGLKKDIPPRLTGHKSEIPTKFLCGNFLLIGELAAKETLGTGSFANPEERRKSEL